MFKNIIAKIRDDEHQFLGFVVGYQKIINAYRQSRSKLQCCFYNVLLIYSIVFSIGMVLQIIISFEYNAFLLFMEYVEFPLISFRMYLFTKRYDEWMKVYEIILKLESKTDDKVVNKCREDCAIRVTSYFIFVSIVMTLFFLSFFCNNIMLPVFLKDYKEVVIMTLCKVWLPIDKASFFGSTVDTIMQMVYGITNTTYVIFLDCLMVSVMFFIVGEIKVVRARYVRALDDPSEETCMSNLIQCHRQYLEIKKCLKLTNNLLSTPMFVYLLLISVNYGVSIQFFSKDQGSLWEQINAIVAPVGLLAQMFFYNNTAHQIIIESELLCYGMFESSWVYRSHTVRRCLLLCSTGARKRLAFTAGPINEISLVTFVAILRLSYSFYTLLKVV